MKKAILIAEKPSLMREIRTVFNKHKSEYDFDIDFLAQAGHLMGLKLPKEINADKYGKWDLGMFPEIYPYEYKINDGKNKLLQDIKNAVKKGGYDFVIHAGDPDGEGELLICETLEYIKNTLPVMRFWTNDLTEGAIVNALHNLKPDSEYSNIYNAALTRQHEDYQFGMNFTGAVTLKKGELCKLGRVKGGIIALIVMRELEIENYVEKKTYKPAFTYKDCEFVYNKAFDTEKEAFVYKPDTLIANVKDITEKEKSIKAPKLFKLSTLQTEAHKILKWSGQKTLQILQDLYETRAVTYPRTGCEYISSAVDIGNVAKSVIKERLITVNTSLLERDPKDIKSDKTYCNDKAIAQEGHTAIIPTGNGLSNSASAEHKALYEIICRRFIAIFSKPKRTKTTKVTAIPVGREEVYEWSETIDLDPGFEVILNPQYKVRTSCGVEFKKPMELNPIEFHVKECVTTPPSRYNDGTLIAALDKPEAFEDEEGNKTKFKIGTPATRATIIEECQKNGYFDKKKGVFYATEKAKDVYLTFKDVSLFNPQESGRWEAMFDSVRNGEKDGASIESILEAEMKTAITKIKETQCKRIISDSSPNKANVLGECPKCGSSVLKGQYGAYCSGKCGISLGKIYGKTLTDAQIKSVLAGKSITIKNLTSKAGKKYNAKYTPDGIEEYEYNGKKGYQIKYNTEFVK